MRRLKMCSARLRVILLCLGGAAAGCDAREEPPSAFPSPASFEAVEVQAQRVPAAQGACNVQISPSTSCGVPLAPGDERSCSAGARAYRVHAGKTMSPCNPVPLVIDIPDRGESAAQHMGREPYCSGDRCRHGLGSGWVAEADMPSGGFIVVVPEGLAELRTSSERGAALRAIVEAVDAVANVDRTKVYLSGSGAGADAAVGAGCDNSEDWAGLAVHGGRPTCLRIGKPTPFIAFGTRADAATFSRGRAIVDDLRDLDGCDGEPTTWRIIGATETSSVCRSAKNDPSASLVPCSSASNPQLAPTTCTGWGRCEAGSGVVFCDVAPDLDRLTAAPVGAPDYLDENGTSLNMPSVAWRFFKTLR